jgi:hypothetical protein
MIIYFNERETKDDKSTANKEFHNYVMTTEAVICQTIWNEGKDENSIESANKTVAALDIFDWGGGGEARAD